MQTPATCEKRSEYKGVIVFTMRKSMRPQSAKAKGRRLQQKVAQSIVDAFPHLEADDCVSTSMGAGGEDVKLSPLARRTIPISIECKNQERLNIWACIEQNEKNCPDGAESCLIFSRNNAKTYAVLPWETILSLFQTRYEAQAASTSVSPASASPLPPDLVDLLAKLSKWVPQPVDMEEGE